MSRSSLPVHVTMDSTLRVKITDLCRHKCTFCHNEGTPVAGDNRGQAAGQFTAAGRSGRVSIYLETNGASFLPASMPPDGFAEAIDVLRSALDFDEIHLTGGEPMLYTDIVDVTRRASRKGFVVGITSNGDSGSEVIAQCAEAGLDRVNFSVFGTTAEELAEVQHPKLRNPKRALLKINELKKSIGACVANGVKASANIVVPDYSHAPRVHRLLDEYAPELSVRLLNSLHEGDVSVRAIERILEDRNAVPEAIYLTAGASGSRTAYRMRDDRVVYFKQIRPVRLPDTCAGCRFNNDQDCEEGFYGVRLYYDTDGVFRVGVCIQRMDLCLPLNEFVTSSYVGEIRRLRQREWERLSARQAG
jgi:molybdenum cofactor biosynthesis enzyme MoaA